MRTPVIIGIAGGSSSGKTTFSAKVIESLPDNITVLSHDYYYSPFSNLSFEEKTKQNFDHPQSFDTDLLISHIKALKENKSIDAPVYSFTEFTRLDKTKKMHPTKVIIIEGILIFENKELRDLMDIKIFVDTDDDIRFIRRLQRDTVKRNRSVDSVVNQYLQTVKPMHDLFVAPSKKYADIIVPEGGHNSVALDMTVQKIISILNI